VQHKDLSHTTGGAAEESPSGLASYRGITLLTEEASPLAELSPNKYQLGRCAQNLRHADRRWEICLKFPHPVPLPEGEGAGIAPVRWPEKGLCERRGLGS